MRYLEAPLVLGEAERAAPVVADAARHELEMVRRAAEVLPGGEHGVSGECLEGEIYALDRVGPGGGWERVEERF